MEKDGINFNEQFRTRSRNLAMSICRWIEELPKNQALYYLKGQVIRSGTSVAANFRAATRARSTQEYYSKLCIVVEECDETLFWLEFIEETFSIRNEKTPHLIKETTELLAVFSTTKRKLNEKFKSLNQ
jgi:four helix bundle protein